MLAQYEHGRQFCVLSSPLMSVKCDICYTRLIAQQLLYMYFKETNKHARYNVTTFLPLDW